MLFGARKDGCGARPWFGVSEGWAAPRGVGFGGVACEAGAAVAFARCDSKL